MLKRFLISLLLTMSLLVATPVLAAELRLSEVEIAPCDASDPGAQPGQAHRRVKEAGEHGRTST